MTEPSTLDLAVGLLLIYWMVSFLFKMCLVFLWCPEQFVLGERHPSHNTLMIWIDLIFAFIMVPVIPEIYYVYLTLFKRKT